MAIPKKYYPDLGNDASYVWNFFASFTEVIILEETSVGLGKYGCLLRLLNVCRCDGHVKLGHNSLRKPVGERHLFFQVDSLYGFLLFTLSFMSKTRYSLSFLLLFPSFFGNLPLL